MSKLLVWFCFTAQEFSLLFFAILHLAIYRFVFLYLSVLCRNVLQFNSRRRCRETETEDTSTQYSFFSLIKKVQITNINCCLVLGWSENPFFFRETPAANLINDQTSFLVEGVCVTQNNQLTHRVK